MEIFMHPNSFWQDQDFVVDNEWRANPDIVKIPIYETNYYEAYASKFLEVYFSCRATTEFKQSVQHEFDFYPIDGNYYRHLSTFMFGDTTVLTNPYQLRNTYQYFTFQDVTGNNINTYDHIFEIGGGAGDFAKFILRNGFKGEYSIIDIPSTFKVSKKNLKGYNVNFLNKLPAVIPKNSLLISTWGLSEIPLEERTVIQEDFKGGIIAYQQQIFGVDNAKYFKDWKGCRLNMPWVAWDGGSYFLSW